MNAKRWMWALCAVALFNAPRSASAGELLKAPSRGIPDQYIVVIDPSAVKLVAAASSTNGAAATRQLATAIAQQVNARPAAVYGNVRQFLVNVPESVALRLARDPRVLLVEQDATFTVSAIPSCYSASSFPAANSYDPTSPQTISCWDPQLSCSDNWGLDRIDQRTGTQSAHTLDGRYYFTANGQGTHIYLLDTGIATGHTEFALPGGASRIGSGTNVVPGSPSWDVWDYVGHGTHVASIAAGRRFGVAKGATVHPVKFSENGATTVSTAVSGVNWIIANVQRPAVVNMSFNYNRAPGYPNPNALDSAVHQMVATYAIPVVNSAGNWNQDANNFSPTDLPEVIVAAGLDWFNNQHWGADPNVGCHTNGCGSDWGSAVDLYAPATDVLAALASGERNLACDLTGTSMAAPHVSGVVAQYLQTHTTATPAQIESAIIANATTGAVTGNLGGSPNRMLYTNY